VRKVPPKERCNSSRFGVVVGDGVDGVHGGRWAENRAALGGHLLDPPRASTAAPSHPWLLSRSCAHASCGREGPAFRRALDVQPHHLRVTARECSVNART
jgi:hypothetical protein